MNYRKIMMALLVAIIVLSLVLMIFLIFHFGVGKAKDNRELTWEEYEALTLEQQMDFQNSFESMEEFYIWMDKAQAKGIDVPWENGGKKPENYTWKEFNALSAEEQEVFFEWFESAENFEKWREEAEYNSIVEEVPWSEDEAKKPEEYTWKEFEELTGEEKELFFEYFESSEEFEEWQEQAQGNDVEENVPWNEENTKKPDEYSWKEFEALTPEEQEAFFGYFESAEEFENWKYEAKNRDLFENVPWNADNSKKPDEYTIEEFEALTPEEQELFFEWFDTAEKFEDWMKNAG